MEVSMNNGMEVRKFKGGLGNTEESSMLRVWTDVVKTGKVRYRQMVESSGVDVSAPV